MADKHTGIYHSSAVVPATSEDLRKLCEELRLGCSDEDIAGVRDNFRQYSACLQRVYDLPDLSLPVKYPRTPGHRPTQADNPCNAWYWCCDIKGSGSGLLLGRTVGVKDNIAVAGVPMMNGSRLLEGYVPEFDATVVTRILDAGGNITGKTSCEDMCISGSSFLNARGPVRHPHDKSRDCGGSSSGSAALLSLGEIDLALGTDQLGSIRIPASWTGVVGLMPTFGLVPFTGAASIDTCRDVIGPMARTVTDCALLLQVIEGDDDNKDPRQSGKIPPQNYIQKLDKGIEGCKIGVLKEGFEMCTCQSVCDVVSMAARRLTDAGADVEDVSIPEHADGLAIASVIATEGTYNCMIKGNGFGFSWKGFYPTSLQEAISKGYAARPHELSPLVKTYSLLGEYMYRKYGSKFYSKAQNLALMLRKRYDEALKTYDVIIMPTATHLPPRLPGRDASLKDILDRGLSMFGNTAPFNCTGHPALTVNAGRVEGLPVGMMIVGRHFDDLTILQVARAYEKIRED
ncbi:amidase-like [Haliotis rufescens]|uniref:amidase-like n=1 Tax=Haliotis rufescens TaxID=6454 RepID=UPI00201E96AC|nr:amidase-like [Haliotis rufescens]